MKKTVFILASTLAAITGLSFARQSGEPVFEGFPWPDPADEIILEVATVESMRIDGDLDDAGWKAAGHVKSFYRASDAGASEVEASIGVLYDGENLLFSLDLPGAEASDSLQECYLSNEYDLIRSGPHVRICLDPLHEHGVYYQFVIDPAGRKEDLRVFDESWSAMWSARVRQSGGRWQAEILIPVSEISAAPDSPKEGEIWGFNVVLSGIAGEEALSSTPIRIDLVDAERFGHLLFKGNLSDGRLETIKSSLPRVHREQKEAKLEANRKICGPDLENIPGELQALSVGKEYSLKSGLEFTCLGVDNPEIIRTRYPFFYEKYENPDLQRLKKQYRL
ncbi:MAG: hypothetical protein U9N45_05810, partial [Gemmatimonadota bacterium]|nr:hypothetical protein [Gemmatimonadota bacterium]